MNQRPTFLIVLVILMHLIGCKAYKQDVLFRFDNEDTPSLQNAASAYEGNYMIQEDDILQLEVFTNKGERLIDPNSELQAGQNGQGGQNRNQYQYLVQEMGIIKLPIIGDQKVTGLTVDQTEEFLEKAYDTYYKNSFVKLTLLNRRVVVLGSGGGQVIPLENEKVTLLEVLGLYGGLEPGSKADKIKLVRGDLENPQVYHIDLSSIAAMKASIIQIEPGDVIYIEPWRRPFLQSIRDYSPVLGITSSIIALYLVIENLSSSN